MVDLLRADGSVGLPPGASRGLGGLALLGLGWFGNASGQPAPIPSLTQAQPCCAAPDFFCSTLTVPLDHAGQVPGQLNLAVAMTGNADAPKGVLLLLAGGPGQRGAALLPRFVQWFSPEVRQGYRLVMFDQRGTGSSAIDCPALQAAVGGSDVRTPPPEAVDACAASLGQARDFYGTPDTVADIELLRRALGAERLTLDGTSYGSYTAEHYALRWPEQVAALVLDAVVPHDGFDPLGVDLMAATGPVLREACQVNPACTSDPADDLAWLVRGGQVGGQPIEPTRLMGALSDISNSDDLRYAEVTRVLHLARQGDMNALEQFLKPYDETLPANRLSAGLHLATLCTDLRFPWGDSASHLAGRAAALEGAIAALTPEALWPYDARTVRALLAVSGCLRWPPARPSALTPGGRIRPRTLIVHGDRDLYCPLDWARREAALLDQGRLVIVPGGGHSLQGAAYTSLGRDAVNDFLLGR